MKKVIIDASFVLRALLTPESDIAKIFKNIFKEQKIQKVKVYSTSFLPYEVANGLRFSLKDQKLAEEIFSKFNQLEIEYFNLNSQQIQKILSMSYNFGATVYDTSYHFLAKLIEGDFYTCDREYFLKAEKEGNIFLIK